MNLEQRKKEREEAVEDEGREEEEKIEKEKEKEMQTKKHKKFFFSVEIGVNHVKIMTIGQRPQRQFFNTINELILRYRVSAKNLRHVHRAVLFISQRVLRIV